MIHTIKNTYRDIRDRIQLLQLNLEFNPSFKLRHISRQDLGNAYTDTKINQNWDYWLPRLSALSFPRHEGGVNPGDQRALFTLTQYFKPKSVLEIGTHIGASTTHIAAALSSQPDTSLTTIDIVDVNDLHRRHWKKYNAPRSPLENLKLLEIDDRVNFVISDSTMFFDKNNSKFDLIFLDGDHSVRTVFKEVPAALSALNPNGIIILHDYFPQKLPLWENGVTVPGPWNAVEKLRKSITFDVIPLGELPWNTKLNSNVTSLAILTSLQHIQ